MNWFDYFLGVGILAIIPLALAAYGGQVAADAIDDVHRRRSVKVRFWAMCFIGIAIAAIYQYRITKSDSDRQTSTKNWQDGILKKLDVIVKQPVSTEQQRAAIDLKREVTNPPTTESRQGSEKAEYVERISNVSEPMLRSIAEEEIAKPLTEKHAEWQRQDNRYQAELMEPLSKEEEAEIGRKRIKLRQDFLSGAQDLLAKGTLVKAELQRRDELNKTLPSQEEKDLARIIAVFYDPSLY